MTITTQTNMYLHNPRCSKSRQGLALLHEHDCNVPMREYLKDPLDRHEIVALSKALGQHPSEFLRRKEPISWMPQETVTIFL